jgi:hypothetical protein
MQMSSGSGYSDVFTRPIVSLFPMQMPAAAGAAVSAAAAPMTAAVGKGVDAASAVVEHGMEAAGKFAARAAEKGTRAVQVTVSGAVLAVGLAAAAVGAFIYGRPEGELEEECSHGAGCYASTCPTCAGIRAAQLAATLSAAGSASEGEPEPLSARGPGADPNASGAAGIAELDLASPTRRKHMRVPTTVRQCACSDSKGRFGPGTRVLQFVAVPARV